MFSMTCTWSNVARTYGRSTNETKIYRAIDALSAVCKDIYLLREHDNRAVLKEHRGPLITISLASTDDYLLRIHGRCAEAMICCGPIIMPSAANTNGLSIRRYDRCAMEMHSHELLDIGFPSVYVDDSLLRIRHRCTIEMNSHEPLAMLLGGLHENRFAPKV